MIEYRFVALNTARMMFKLVRNSSTIIVSLNVDDCLVAHNSDAEYQIFLVIDVLSERFELSAEASEVSWYLGVGVSHDWEKGTVAITLCQNQYLQDLLARVQMTDANPVITPMKVRQQLTSEDCPEMPDKQTAREYQQIMGSLYYLV